MAALAAGAAGCGGESTGETDPTTTTTTTTEVELPPPMEPLPGIESTKTARFATSGACNQCHLAGESPVMHDDAGRDLSPAYLWRSSMMAFAAKDPYYLAVFSEARESRPAAKATIDAVCTRCHAPAGSEENGGALGFDAIAAGAGPEAHLGRDGVTCSLCHQIGPDNLGKDASFSGGFEVGFDREMFGPHEAPNPQPMQFFVDYTPTFAPHATKSEVCATCHTVIVPILDDEGAPTGDTFVEQAPYFEWQNSQYGATTPCGDCHLPRSDAAGLPIESPIAKFPENLPVRSPFGQHTFEGGNAYMLRVLADNVAWTGSLVASAELMDAADRGEAHLATAAELSIPTAGLVGSDLIVTVEIANRTGHKLPTGYPSRRMWLHVTAEGESGEVVFESGRPGEGGSILDAAGARVDVAGKILPHLDDVAADAVQVWEAVAVDRDGAPTHRPLDQVKLGKDDRLLPAGYSTVGPRASLTAPVGVEGDATFEAGKDRVKLHVPGGASVKRVTVELLYQTLPRTTAEALAVTPTPAAVRFSEMTAARPPSPVTMATATWE